MRPGGPGGGGGRPRPAPLRTTVVRNQRLSPHLARITVTGEQFHRYRWVGPAAHFKLTIPNPGSVDVDIPEPDADGNVTFGNAPRIMRTYTARHFDPATRTLDIDIVLHGEGPVAAWAAQVEPGGRLAVSVPRSAGFVQNDDAEWLLIAGDASALPALATIADVVTKPTTVMVEVDEVADQLDLGRPVHWVTRPAAALACAELERALADFVPPSGRGQVWVAAEAGAIRPIRSELLTRFEREQVTTRGYWRAGAQNHPDHDYGEEG